MSVPIKVTILNELFEFGFKNGSSLFISQLVDAGYAEFASKLSSEWGTDNKINLDEMADLFDNFAANVGCTVLVFVAETFGNAAYFAFAQFEKYGGDPLKRSLTNQLMSQFVCPVMISITFNFPITLCRIWFGPLPSRLADLHMLIGKLCRYWFTLTFTEGFAIKALTLLSFEHMVNINDDFMAKFLTRVNGMLSIGFALTQFYLGYFEDNELYQTFVGKTIETGRRGTDWIDIVFSALSISVTGFSCLAISTKKAYEWYKDCKRFMTINVGNVGQGIQHMTEKSVERPDQFELEQKGSLGEEDLDNQRVENFQGNDAHAERCMESEAFGNQIQIDEQNTNNRRTPEHREIVLQPNQSFFDSEEKGSLGEEDLNNQRVENFQGNDTHAERCMESEAFGDQIQIDKQNTDNRRTPELSEIVLQPLQLVGLYVQAQEIKFNNEKYNKPALGVYLVSVMMIMFATVSVITFFFGSNLFIFRFYVVVLFAVFFPILAFIFKRGYWEYFITMLMDTFY